MRTLTVKEVEIFDAFHDHPAIRILLDVIRGESESYDDLIATPITDMTGIVSQQQAIGAKRALQDILKNHKTIIKEAVKHAELP
jgi:hypothetical protein